ncbi:MAG TPA: hypothetical protein VMN76_10150 [Acidobacteriota bacterium]|nr:hypothetical protein [Acidobacteriota bacterium]
MLAWFRLTALALLLILPASLACATRTLWNIVPSGRLMHPEIQESSGIVASRQFQGVLWTHNDSRNPPQIFAVKRSGQFIRKYHLEGAENIDWEDIALDESNNLFILENSSRTDPQKRTLIYIVPEPNPFQNTQSAVTPAGVLSVRFPNEAAYDCEALFVWKGNGYLVTKSWDGSLPKIFRFQIEQGDGTAVYEGEVPVHTMVTGGDISTDGTRIILISYLALLLFDGPGDPVEMLRTHPLISRLNARQVEAVTFYGQDRVIISNEQRDIFELKIRDLLKRKAPFVRTPREEVPNLDSRPDAGRRLEDWRRGLWLEAGTTPRAPALGRVAWSEDGLHVGISLPPDLHLAPLVEPEPGNFDDWFKPGRIYVLINPDGLRPLSFGDHDRCIVIGTDDSGQIAAQSRFLRPATFVEAVEDQPDWLDVEKDGGQILVTVRPSAPGFLATAFEDSREIGFNVIVIHNNGDLLSWAPMTRRFIWDSPSVWGVLELDR